MFFFFSLKKLYLKKNERYFFQIYNIYSTISKSIFKLNIRNKETAEKVISSKNQFHFLNIEKQKLFLLRVKHTLYSDWK